MNSMEMMTSGPDKKLEIVNAVLNKDILVLRKHDKLVRMPNPLTKLQHKIYNIMLVKAQLITDIVDPTQKHFNIDIKTLANLSGMSAARNPTYLKETLSSLLQTDIQIEQDDETYSGINLLGSYSVAKGVLNYNLTDDILKLVKEKERFANLVTQELKKLNNKYSLILYEICINARHRNEIEISLDELKKIMQHPDYEYKYIKSKVINSAILEINTSTNIKVDYKEIKKKGKVVGIKVEIKEIQKPLNSISDHKKENIIITLLEQLKIGHTKKDAKVLAANYKLENLTKAYHIYKKAKSEPLNPIAYFTNIVKNYEQYGYYTPEEQETLAAIEKDTVSNFQKKLLESIDLETKGLLKGGVSRNPSEEQ